MGITLRETEEEIQESKPCDVCKLESQSIWDKAKNMCYDALVAVLGPPYVNEKEWWRATRFICLMGTWFTIGFGSGIYFTKRQLQ